MARSRFRSDVNLDRIIADSQNDRAQHRARACAVGNYAALYDVIAETPAGPARDAALEFVKRLMGDAAARGQGKGAKGWLFRHSHDRTDWDRYEAVEAIRVQRLRLNDRIAKVAELRDDNCSSVSDSHSRVCQRLITEGDGRYYFSSRLQLTDSK